MQDFKRTLSKLQIKRLSSDDLSVLSQQIVDFIKYANNANSWDKVGVSIANYTTDNRIWLSYRRVHSLKPEDLCKVITLLTSIDPEFLTKGESTIEIEHISLPVGM